MKELDGFHLRLICAAHDLSFADANFQAELKAVLQPLSLNDYGVCRWDLIRINTQTRRSTALFISLMHARDPVFWESLVCWIQGQPGRSLKLRFKNTGRTAHSLVCIAALLEKTLKHLQAISHQNKAST